MTQDYATIAAGFITSLKAIGSTALQLAGDINNTNISETLASTTRAGIGTLSATGNFADDTVVAEGQLTTFSVTKQVSGAGQKFAAGLAVPSANNKLLTGIANLTVGAWNSDYLSTQHIGTFKVIGNGAASLTGAVEDSGFNILGSLGGVGLGTFTAVGPVSSCEFTVAAGNVTSFTASQFLGSDLLVGASLSNENDLAGSTAAFSGTFSIASFKTTAPFFANDILDTASFSNSDLGAAKLGTVTLAGVNVANTGDPALASFGIFFSNAVSTNKGTVTADTMALTPSTSPQSLLTISGEFFYEGK